MTKPSEMTNEQLLDYFEITSIRYGNASVDSQEEIDTDADGALAKAELLNRLAAQPSGEPPQPRCPKCGKSKVAVTPVSANGTEPPLIVRCHCCKGTQIWKRNDAGEVEVYHDCASGLHAAKERIKELEAGAASHNGQGWEAELAELRNAKDAAYSERDNLVAALSKLFPSALERHPDSDTTWENDWRWIVFIDLPTGQATWHIHDSELAMFDHLPRFTGRTWDGHTTPQKYLRLAALPAPPSEANGPDKYVEFKVPKIDGQGATEDK